MGNLPDVSDFDVSITPEPPDEDREAILASVEDGAVTNRVLPVRLTVRESSISS